MAPGFKFLLLEIIHSQDAAGGRAWKDAKKMVLALYEGVLQRAVVADVLQICGVVCEQEELPIKMNITGGSPLE